MKQYFLRILCTVFVILPVASCAFFEHDDEYYYGLASNLPAISNAVGAYADSPGTPAELIGPALIIQATKNNPVKLDSFKDLYITARRVGIFTSVLVCDANQGHAYFEDTDCTVKIDQHFWRDAPDSACQFTLDLEKACE